MSHNEHTGRIPHSEGGIKMSNQEKLPSNETHFQKDLIFKGPDIRRIDSSEQLESIIKEYQSDSFELSSFDQLSEIHSDVTPDFFSFITSALFLEKQVNEKLTSLKKIDTNSKFEQLRTLRLMIEDESFPAKWRKKIFSKTMHRLLLCLNFHQTMYEKCMERSYKALESLPVNNQSIKVFRKYLEKFSARQQEVLELYRFFATGKEPKASFETEQKDESDLMKGEMTTQRLKRLEVSLKKRLEELSAEDLSTYKKIIDDIGQKISNGTDFMKQHEIGTATDRLNYGLQMFKKYATDENLPKEVIEKYFIEQKLGMLDALYRLQNAYELNMDKAIVEKKISTHLTTANALSAAMDLVLKTFMAVDELSK